MPFFFPGCGGGLGWWFSGKCTVIIAAYITEDIREDERECEVTPT